MSAKAIREWDGKRLLHDWLMIEALKSPSTAQDYACSLTASFRAIRLASPFETSSSTIEGMINDSILWNKLEENYPWLTRESLVLKPDQLIKRRGKLGLVKLRASLDDAKTYMKTFMEKEISDPQSGVSGVLRNFIIEPFVPHESHEEHYLCIRSVDEGEEILFSLKGGVDVGDVDTNAARFVVPIGQKISSQEVDENLLEPLFSSTANITETTWLRKTLAHFISHIFHAYDELFFTYLEINPFVVTSTDKQVHLLDLAVKLDQTAYFECFKLWGDLEFPAPFGRDLTPEERYIADLDSKTGASLKLTILNAKGRIWTMVAGGGASVAYSDAIANLGFADELANYGEYSGAPNESETYEYAKTILDLMTRGEPREDGKILIIGGGIANFTNVATTFRGIVRALSEYQHNLISHKVRIFIRRGGPNYQEGLKMMKHLGDQLGIPIKVYGPEIHLTSIVPIALGIIPENDNGIVNAKNISKSLFDSPQQWLLATPQLEGSYGANFSSANETNTYGFPSTTSIISSDAAIVTDKVISNGPLPTSTTATTTTSSALVYEEVSIHQAGQVDREPGVEYFRDTKYLKNISRPWYEIFSRHTRAFIFGMQPKAVQSMMDFDHMCRRQVPSVAAMIYPFGGEHVQKFYWGASETLVPIFTSVKEAIKKFPEVDCVVNFASFRSVYETTMEMLEHHKQIRTIAIIAEGVPEKRSKLLRKVARERGVTLIGPATVGGLKPGCFKIGNTGGMIDNMIASRLYRPGSVAYVAKSGGLSSELNNIISLFTNGVYEGISIGGDRYPGSTFLDHLLRFEADPNCHLLLLLGEVGGLEEYRVCEAIANGSIRKPVVAWCIGTCASVLKTEVQFGHAGALANSALETADAKNKALRAVGAFVPGTFEELPSLLKELYEKLVETGTIQIMPEPAIPRIPMDFAWASELGLVRKPAHFVSTICDDRGQELLYAGMPISSVFQENIGIGGVVSLLWFRRRLPDYACKFIEMVLMLTADHGPAVSGAHNTIVTARAGKDLVSSVCSGLLTIGDRFGGALDGAAQQYSAAYDEGLSPFEFVDKMRRKHELILGIGHKVKSKRNPDLRVTILKDYAFSSFPATPLIHYALEVEKITTAKKDNLILNVDGMVAVAFVDLLRHCGAFTAEEAEEYIKIGTLNGLFVLGRTIGFIGHFIDQRRLKQGLYRHPWDDISYLSVSR